MTPSEIRRFQETHRDWNGRLLTVDGQIGPKTRWALAIDDLPAYRRRIVIAATRYVGMQERTPGSNSGPLIDEWLKSVGVGPGDPWCAAFVYAVLTEAGVSARATASAKQCLEQYQRRWYPDPGDLFGWVNVDGTGHVGFVIGDVENDALAVVTCEGNSANSVRVCTRPSEGLQFRRVAPPACYLPLVQGAPLVQRAVEGTR